ncbi:4-hydroxybenzoate octaprenyltransferase [Thiomicrospira sp. WB1]|nr:4-hydroxybenzoate octaprenyltransferase [Thiomicrospira sp. WB1]
MMMSWRDAVDLTRLNRPVGIYLVLWPTLWGLWLAAEGVPPIWVLIVFVLGTVLMRSAGCVINDYADRHFDGHVARTCDRPLATGRVSEKQALGLFVLLGVLAFALVLTLNGLTIALSLVGLGLSALYPFMKRHTHWPQLFLGAAFAWAIPMSFSAVQAQVPVVAWWVYATTLVWALIYDTAYAIYDKPDDLKVGIKSTAVLFGDYVRPAIFMFQLLMLAGLVAIGWVFELGWAYAISVVIAAGLMGYHQILLGKGQASSAFQAFLHNHWIGAVIWLGLVVAYL